MSCLANVKQILWLRFDISGILRYHALWRAELLCEHSLGEATESRNISGWNLELEYVKSHGLPEPSRLEALSDSCYQERGHFWPNSDAIGLTFLWLLPWPIGVSVSTDGRWKGQWSSEECPLVPVHNCSVNVYNCSVNVHTYANLVQFNVVSGLSVAWNSAVLFSSYRSADLEGRLT
jgi:hypothetical protein